MTSSGIDFRNKMADDDKLSLERGSFHDRGVVACSIKNEEVNITENESLLPELENRDGRLVSRRSLDQPREKLAVKWRCVEFAMISLAAVSLVLVLIANGFATFTDERGQFGLQFSTSRLSGYYPTDVTPNNWTFWVIWPIIYLWQIAWIFYAFSFPFRPAAARTLSLPVYGLYAFSSVCNIVWIYLFGNDLIVGSLTFIILFYLSLLLTLGFATYQTATVAKLANKWSLWFTRILVHNGLAFYTAWLSIAWLLNVAIVADKRQSGALDRIDAGTLALSILGGQIIVWFLLEHVCFNRYFRYVQVVYVVYLVALVSIVEYHWEQDNDERTIRNQYYSLALLILTFVLQIGKLILTVIFECRDYRSRKNGRDQGIY